MNHPHKPRRAHKTEVLWQTLDIAAILAVVCLATAYFVHNIAVSIILGVLALASVVLYLIIELKIEYKLAKSHRPKMQQDPSMTESRTNLLLWGIIISSLAIGNFFLLFERHGVSMSTVPTTAALYKDAITLMFFTVVACLLAHTLHHRYHFAKSLNFTGIHKARTLKSYILACLYTFIIIYVAIIITPYRIDIAFALLAAIVYIAFREFQRYDRKNHRKFVQALHRDIHIKLPK